MFVILKLSSNLPVKMILCVYLSFSFLNYSIQKYDAKDMIHLVSLLIQVSR